LDKCDIRNFNLKNGDTIIFSFGEIDCRCHVYKHIKTSLTYQQIIDDIVNNYIEAIKINIEISKIIFKNICIYNIVPPVQKYNTVENLHYPYLGNDEERKKICIIF
jgi:hypothetical protein